MNINEVWIVGRIVSDHVIQLHMVLCFVGQIVLPVFVDTVLHFYRR